MCLVSVTNHHPHDGKSQLLPHPRLAYKSKLAKNQSRKVRTSAKMCPIQLNNAFPPRFGTKKGRVLKCENRFFVSWINNWHFLLRCGTEYQWKSSMERATIICVKGQICWEPKLKKKKTIFMMNLKLLAKQTHNLEKDFDFNL